MKKILLILILLIEVLFVGCRTNQDNSDNSIINTTIILKRSGAFTMPNFAIEKVTITHKGLLHELFFYNQTLTNATYTKFENDEYNSKIQVSNVGQATIRIITLTKDKSILIEPYITNGYSRKIVNIINALNEQINRANSAPITYLKY